MTDTMIRKLRILADAAKYDVSCASSGASRGNASGGLGNAVLTGLCHSFSADGRCISLLKVLLSNVCSYDCAYCVNRRSNDRPRAAFTPEELATLTIELYRRNYIEGLFLSSGVHKSVDDTMERMLAVLRLLRGKHRFNGYVHMKCIPGASPELVRGAALLADRLSVNVEIPSEPELLRLAPEKNYPAVFSPMRQLSEGIAAYEEDRGRGKRPPAYVPAGQSTQLLIGASPDSDLRVLSLASMLYSGPKLQRVYYSGFIPVNGHDTRLPALPQPPLRRENRLYQADWLMRKYGFNAGELVSAEAPDLELDIDPKLAWALRHPEVFPLDPNRADYLEILRVPGIGVTSARRIVGARRQRRLDWDALKRLGVAMKRAKHFLAPDGQNARFRRASVQETGTEHVRRLLSGQSAGREYWLPLTM